MTSIFKFLGYREWQKSLRVRIFWPCFLPAGSAQWADLLCLYQVWATPLNPCSPSVKSICWPKCILPFLLFLCVCSWLLGTMKNKCLHLCMQTHTDMADGLIFKKLCAVTPERVLSTQCSLLNILKFKSPQNCRCLWNANQFPTKLTVKENPLNTA